jgi:dTDP-glucose pyrophosphorylase
MADLEHILVLPTHTVRMVMAAIDRGAKGIALVVDEERRLLGTVTDGDIRRLILGGGSLDAPVSELLARKAGTLYPRPVTAHPGASPDELLQTMRKHKIRQLPVVDGGGHVVDLVTMEDLLPEQTLPLQAVIMAGGFGKRLRPITEELPKPMLPIGDRPLMELIIEQLRQAGIRRASIMTHYLADKITSYFGDGRAFGIEIDYVNEEHPLGTAGALSLMEAPQEPILVINGDILTRVDFRAMLAYHREQSADLTVGVRHYDMQVPYGVVECEGPRVHRLREKPRLSFLVNAGIYLLEPEVHQYIPQGQRFDMTDLIEKLLEEKRKVVAFPIVEYWIDIGQLEDYEKAQEDVRAGRLTPR